MKEGKRLLVLLRVRPSSVSAEQMTSSIPDDDGEDVDENGEGGRADVGGPEANDRRRGGRGAKREKRTNLPLAG